MNQDTLAYRIALSLIKGIGPKLARNLIAYLGSEQVLFEEKMPTLARIPGIGSGLEQMLRGLDRQALLQRAEEERAFIARHRITPLFFSDQAFPRRLSYCDDGPLMLYTSGNICFDSSKVIAIVGTRTPTEQGLDHCENLVSSLALRHPGTVIISGLAYGIDICAHRAALKHQLPTAGVLAHGLDRIYPSLHRSTARKMVENGALVTEFLSQTNPDKPNFVKRNRIIAGLADAVIVVESARKGGALITAYLAQGYNRDVLAFPGRPEDEKSKGCNHLIKSNVAALVESVEDLEYTLGWETCHPDSPSVQGNLFATVETSEQRQVLENLLEEREMNLNLLGLKCQMPISQLSAILLELEFKGLIKSRPGGIYRIV